MSWRNDAPTEKQLNYIKIMEEEIGEKFTGSTKGDACDFISKHMKSYKESLEEMWEWATMHGEYIALAHEDAGDRLP